MISFSVRLVIPTIPGLRMFGLMWYEAVTEQDMQVAGRKSVYLLDVRDGDSDLADPA